MSYRPWFMRLGDGIEKRTLRLSVTQNLLLVVLGWLLAAIVLIASTPRTLGFMRYISAWVFPAVLFVTGCAMKRIGMRGGDGLQNVAFLLVVVLMFAWIFFV